MRKFIQVAPNLRESWKVSSSKLFWIHQFRLEKFFSFAVKKKILRVSYLIGFTKNFEKKYDSSGQEKNSANRNSL